MQTFVSFQTAFVFKFKAVSVLFISALGLSPAPYMGLAIVGQDIVNFGCSSLSAVVPADELLFGFLFLSCTY